MQPTRFNPTVFLTIALPAFAVLASVGTAILAISSGDPQLPGRYHWEGDKLDHDFAQSRRAAELNVKADLNLRPVAGVCNLTLRMNGNLPSAVDVSLVHVSRPALDRRLRFTRDGLSSSYSTACPPLPAERWHVELSDLDNSWSFRSDTAGELDRIILSSN